MNAVEESVSQRTQSPPSEEWRIGSLLIRSGRLRKDDVIKVIQLQRQKTLKFGEAAVELGLLTEDDIRAALAQQFSHSYLTPGQSKVTRRVIAAYEPNSEAAESFRVLRSQLMLRWFDSTDLSQRAMAVVGPDAGIGRSWLAANLAVTFSQLGKSTVLIDGDLRNSSQHKLFGIENRQGLSEVLSGRAALASVLTQYQMLPNLAVLTAGATPPNPQELIARSNFRELLDSVRHSADVIIIDTPADSQGADGKIIAKEAGSGLLLAKRHLSRERPLRAYISGLRSTGATLLLSILVD